MSASRGRISLTPSSFRYSSSSGRAGAITLAPALAASWTAKEPTPPFAPTIRTVSPSETPSASMAARAVIAASGAVPALAVSTPSGLRVAIDSGTAMSSAQVPSCTAGLNPGLKPNTSSPTKSPLTSEPACSTTPAKSRPSVTGNSWATISFSIPAAMELSTGFTEEALTRTSTSSSAGVGAGRSLRRPGEESKSSRVMALMVCVFSFLGCLLCMTVASCTARSSRQDEEPPVGHEGGQDEQHRVHGDAAELRAPEVREGGPDHRQHQTEGGQRRQPGQDPRQRRQHDPDRPQHLKGADDAQRRLREVLHPRHVLEQLLLWLRQLCCPRHQERRGHEYLNHPQRDAHLPEPPLRDRCWTIVDVTQRYVIVKCIVCYIVSTRATEATEPTTSGAVLEEFDSSPALMLALLGQKATRR